MESALRLESRTFEDLGLRTTVKAHNGGDRLAHFDKSRPARLTWGPELSVYAHRHGLTAQGIADLLGVKKDTVRRWLGRHGTGAPIPKELFRLILEATTPPEGLALALQVHRIEE